jgi:hypothetical protein
MCSFVHCAQLANFWEVRHIVNVNHQNWVLLYTLPFCLVIRGECPCRCLGMACKKSVVSMALFFIVKLLEI